MGSHSYLQNLCSGSACNQITSVYSAPHLQELMIGPEWTWNPAVAKPVVLQELCSGSACNQMFNHPQYLQNLRKNSCDGLSRNNCLTEAFCSWCDSKKKNAVKNKCASNKEAQALPKSIYSCENL